MHRTNFDDDVSLSVDMVEMGVRPSNWFDESKSFDYEFKDKQLFQYQVYSAEFQPITTNNFIEPKRSTIDDDEQDSNDFDVDPETGERIFREKSVFSPTTKWIDEYISNLENSSRPAAMTTDESVLSNIPSSLFENSDPQWLNHFFPIDENSQSNMFNEIFSSDDIEHQSNMTTITTTTTDMPIDSNDDDLSIISSTKLEKIDRDDSYLSTITSRRSVVHARNSQSQSQQDEEILVEHHIPLSIEQITQSTTEEYNHHLSRLAHLTVEQMNIIKDIRRRGKNKIAAQNCRKRKAVGVEALLEEVDELKRVKQELEDRKKAFQEEIAETRRQYEYLHRQVLPHHQLPPAIRVK